MHLSIAFFSMLAENDFAFGFGSFKQCRFVGRLFKDEQTYERKEQRESPFGIRVPLRNRKKLVRQGSLQLSFNQMKIRNSTIMHPLIKHSDKSINTS